jgi:hypothetical protein
VAANERDASDVAKTVGQLLGLAAGLVALLYAAGGGVLTLRLYLQHLPSRTIAAELPRDLLISIGLAQIVLPILGLGALYATWRVLRGSSARPTRLVRQWQDRSPRGWLELIAVSALPAVVVCGILALATSNVREGSKGLTWLLPVAFLITLLVSLLGLNLRARLVERYGESPASWNAVRPVLSMILVVALVALPICVLIAAAFFPLLDAKVCTTSGLTARGVLIGETGVRTYVGQKAKTTGPLVVFSIPQSEITRTVIGRTADTFECPAS